MEHVTLNNGVQMPKVGFGVFQVDDLAACEQAVAEAIEAGYRHIDTAVSYQNEEAVGAAIAGSGVPRDELFVTTKAYIHQMGCEKTLAAFDESLEKLGLDYLDLYLIHMPFGDYYGAWRAMGELYRAGRVRAIGVSNFGADRIVDLARNFEVVPAVDQLELHPFYQREGEISVLRGLGVIPECWAPFAEGLNGMFINPVLAGIAAAHGVSVAQVVLRWNVQRGVPVIPKSVYRERMEQNLDVFGFELTADEMAAIAALDLGRPQMFDPRDPAEVARVYDYMDNPVLTTLQ